MKYDNEVIFCIVNAGFSDSVMDAAKELIAKIENGEATYDYVEVMACNGGCVAGDGQACVI